MTPHATRSQGTGHPPDQSRITVRKRVVATALSVGLVGAVLSAFPWTRDMYVGPVVHSYERLAVPPEDVLSLDGPRIMGRRDAREKLANPRPASTEVLEQGAALYHIYCVSCHGADGTGSGALVDYFDRTVSLHDGDVQRMADGEMYNTVRAGGFQMPAFAAALSVDERWAVIHHIRTYRSD